jgi:hypothetical protein
MDNGGKRMAKTTTMDASKLKGLIGKYRETSNAAAVAFAAALERKPSRRRAGPQAKKTPAQQWSELAPPPPTVAELDAQRAAIDAEIDRLYGVVDNVYPAELFKTFCELSQEVAAQAQGMFIEAISQGADNVAGVKDVATLFCRYNDSVNEMAAFAKERQAAKTVPASWATLALLGGLGPYLFSQFAAKKPAP